MFFKIFQAALISAIANLSQSAPLEKTFSLSKSQFNQGYCNIAEATVSIQLTESFGEPLITSQFDWQAGSNTPPDCLPKQLDLWIEWQSNDDRIAYMPITVKTSPSGISGEERLSSPTWSRFICQTKVYTASCFDQQTAQRFIGSNPYAVSFELALFVILSITVILIGIFPQNNIDIINPSMDELLKELSNVKGVLS
ncbi:MAG: hypothetical protein ACO2ZD_06220 [Pseudomonadales bacterium]